MTDADDLVQIDNLVALYRSTIVNNENVIQGSCYLDGMEPFRDPGARK